MVDPREWGAIDIPTEELDVEVQKAALAALAQGRRTSSGAKPAKRAHVEPRRSIQSGEACTRSSAPLESRASRSSKLPYVRKARMDKIIDPKSYIGITLKKVGQVTPMHKSQHRLPSTSSGSSDSAASSSSDDNHSDSSSSEMDNSDSSPSSSESSDDKPKCSQHKSRRRKSKRHTKHSRSRGGAKIFKPKTYNGAADARAYHRFVKESEAYLTDHKIKSKQKAFMLSYFLEGKAYDFYIQKVSRNEEAWTLNRFYTELYNFCFPINYTMQLRTKLARLYQNDKSVSKYSHDLEELFIMIGSISEREQVIKFCNGSRPSIQQALWRDQLNPDTALWRKVVDHAEVIETSERALSLQHKDRRAGGTANSSHRREAPLVPERSNKNSKHHKSFCLSGGHSSGAGSYTPSSSGNHQNSWFVSRHHAKPSSSSRFNPAKKNESNKYTQLSEKEMAERRAAGRCFRCNETGHMSCNCPKGNTVAGKGSKPPSTTNHNLEFVLKEDEPIEVLESLPLGAIRYVDPEQAEWIHLPVVPQSEPGDCYAIGVEKLLNDVHEYPGDDLCEVWHQWISSREFKQFTIVAGEHKRRR